MSSNKSMDSQSEQPSKPRAITFKTQFVPAGIWRRRIMSASEGLAAGGAGFAGLAMSLYKPEYINLQTAVGLVAVVFGLGARMVAGRIGRQRFSEIDPSTDLSKVPPGELANAGRVLGENLHMPAEALTRNKTR